MPVDPHRPQQLFGQALERLPAERAAFLDGACGTDAELRARVGALLDALSAAGDFLAEPEPTAAGHEEHPGAVIDRYKLLQQIGEGGFGTVWMAEQTEPVRRKVALKVIKLGMDTRQVISRFEAERQALALMEHPNIAKVLDGGTSPSGRPFFVMELVKGVPITEYCDQAELGAAERLELVQQVCHAVQHAHQKGVIHRDLKPGNILVTLHDGVPVPKVIDFGIAKATSAELTQKTLFTEFRQMVGTPEYMAPEQAELSGLDIDTRADVYSLGVLLYELLTGTKPFELRSLLDKGYAEMLRVIREDTPPKPSTRVSTLGGQLAAVAKRRHATPVLLSRSLRGDLDWIVMKALEKERARRYATANDLAADIGRHLRDEPVEAGPPSAAYRVRKYVRRHRLGVTAGAAITLALVVGSSVSIWGWLEADAQRIRAVAAEGDAIRQRDDAHTARKRAEDGEREARIDAAQRKEVIGFIADMLGAANPRRGKGPDYTVRQLLDDYDRRLGERLENLPSVEAMVRLLMARAYEAIGSYEKARSHAQTSLEIWRRLKGEEDPVVLGPLVLLGTALGKQNRLEEAEEKLRQALALARKQQDESEQVANVLGALSEVLLRRRRFAAAEKAARQALAMRQRLVPGRRDVAMARDLEHVTHVLMKRESFKEAEELVREAVKIKGAVLGHEDPSYADSLHDLAWVLHQQGKYAEAVPLARRALGIRRAVLGEAHPDVAGTLDNLSGSLAGLGRFEEAEKLLRDAVRLKRNLPGAESHEYAVSLNNLSQVLWQQGKLPEAEKLQREALGIRRKILGDENPSVAIGLDNLGRILLAQGKRDDAEVMLHQSLQMRLRVYPESYLEVAKGRWHYGEALLAQNKLGAAETEWRKAVPFIRSALLATDPTTVASCLGQLGVLLERQNKHAEAEPVLRACLGIYAGKLPDSWLRYNAMSWLGASLLAQGKHADAERLLLDGYGQMQPPVKGRRRKMEALERVVELYESWGKQDEVSEWRARLQTAKVALEGSHGRQR